ncbi:3-oxoacyl-[acyl-carrier-protein] reductase FabG [Aphelenchoides besseyi]|nr:3-oxoacyl-[acyl-carrier-protein] reductase FabG [Aphelenchoides besseyi]
MSFKEKVAIVTGMFSSDDCVYFQIQVQAPTTTDLLKKLNIPDSRVLVVQGAIEEEQTQKRLIDETVKKFGRLNILVNNAAVSYRDDLVPNSLDYVMSVNLRSLIALTRMAIPYLAETKGNVVNVSSAGSQRVSPISQPPGFIETIFRSRHEMSDAKKKSIEKFIEHTLKNDVPLQRGGSPHEAANVIVFLASDKASYVTGANYLVDGGYLTGAPRQKIDSK